MMKKMISTKINLILFIAVTLSIGTINAMKKEPYLQTLWVHNPLPYQIAAKISAVESKHKTTLVEIFFPKCYKPSTIRFETTAKEESISIITPEHTPKYGKIIVSTTTQELATIYALTDPMIFHAQQHNKS